MSTIIPVTINISTITTTTLVAAVTGKRIHVYALFLWAGGTQSITFRDNTPTTLMGQLDMTAQTAFTLDLQSVQGPDSPQLIPWMTTGQGQSFQAVTTAAVQVSGIALYAIEGQ